MSSGKMSYLFVKDKEVNIRYDSAEKRANYSRKTEGLHPPILVRVKKARRPFNSRWHVTSLM